ncbi:hypothetical protein BO83DRAFT_429994 [Aspergillus eucalypticola CBS 122712]|uniref:Alpha/beta-hydrolase n=1 Tax=Aspergillus eucalypticola (strain CBS 122712 / IBT 29274) TaxID=1448314 RepID=A0A317UX88_ASPEC|nr:uncharacterized protein BO83DRAFT_429994 [Aspergillus eucalypticola CBS 122712]PWY66653.1 hypothetical protein BO83DRAFT_429994 [Aspergillus eucalypticola CBS 122712]
MPATPHIILLLGATLQQRDAATVLIDVYGPLQIIQDEEIDLEDSLNQAMNDAIAPRRGNETQLGIPVFVNAGTSEVLYDAIMKFAESLRKNGNEVEVLETPNAANVPYRLGKNWNLEDAQAICLATMTKFLEKTGI